MSHEDTQLPPATEEAGEEREYPQSLIVIGACPEDDDAILNLTQNTRKKIAQDLLKAGLPEDPKHVELALKTLADMDKVALGRKRIKSEEKLNANNANTLSMVANLLNQAASMPDLFKANPETAGPREAPRLPDDIELPPLVPGEMEIGNNHGDNYESFAARFRRSE